MATAGHDGRYVINIIFLCLGRLSSQLLLCITLWGFPTSSGSRSLFIVLCDSQSRGEGSTRLQIDY